MYRSGRSVTGYNMATPLKGRIRVPSDKSISHRVALFSAIAEGTSTVAGLLDSLDVRSTLSIVESLGAKVELDEAPDGTGLAGTITGWGVTGPVPQGDPCYLQCGNSGTTARLLLGLLSGYRIDVTLVGDESLSKRPMARVTGPLSRMGARFEPATQLPIVLSGSDALKALTYESPVASAQVKSAILLAGLNAEGITTVSEPHKSRDHTELLLPAYGVEVEVDGLNASIAGGQSLHAFDCRVPADPSSAAFLLVAAAMIPGSEVTVEEVLINPTRTGFLKVMQRFGADIVIESNAGRRLGAESCGDITVRYRQNLKATRITADEIATLIDEVPILALLAAFAEGETVFEQVGELRVKESDRLAAIMTGLSALGYEAWESDDDLHIVGGTAQPKSTVFETHGDHRLAMTWTIAERAFDLKLEIQDAQCVAVSYPGFFDDLVRLS
ncbi:MAG TPA: 3-phosphoshikimate 1-carboxyvinyltransferase [Coriobacteriia bacterium]|nr:3-phosphoshikimate 1-carboxyvinyltransferase [Coriobacteriia bacterium]